jgi:hypothetical protein
MPVLENRYAKPLDLAMSMLAGNNIAVLGDREEKGLNTLVLGMVRGLRDRATEYNVDSLTGIDRKIYEEAWDTATKTALRILEKNSDLLPSGLIEKIVLIEPSLGTNGSYGSANDFAINIHKTLTNTFKPIEEQCELDRERQIKSLAIDLNTQDREKKISEIEVNIVEKLIKLKTERLVDTMLHEIFHLFERKVYTNSAMEVPAGKTASNAEISADHQIDETSLLRQHVYGLRINIDSRKVSLGHGLNEAFPSLAELFYLKEIGYVPQTNSFQHAKGAKIIEDIKDIDQQDKISMLALLNKVGMYNPGSQKIYSNNISIARDGNQSDIKLSYGYITRFVLDISQEIFREDLMKTGDLYNFTFRKLLEAAVKGKIGLFFKGATFEGLSDLSDKDSRRERQKYIRFISSVPPHPTFRQELLASAFVAAGAALSPKECVETRRQILELADKLKVF